MSRKDLSNFIHAAEHSYSLRKEIHKCRGVNDLIHLAERYNFLITQTDLDSDDTASKVEEWFKTSLIKPIKNNFYN